MEMLHSDGDQGQRGEEVEDRGRGRMVATTGWSSIEHMAQRLRGGRGGRCS